MELPSSRRIGQALGLASCPLSYLASACWMGRGLPPRVQGALVALSATWSATELALGILRPARRTVANAWWVKVTRAVWLVGPWAAFLDARHGWTSISVPGAVQLALIGCGFAGLGLRLAAVLQLGPAFTYDHSVGSRGALATHGVYRFVRHPAYAGLLVLTNLLGVLLGSGIAVVLLASTIPNVLQRMDAEEADLLRVYGDAYRTYSGRSARLLPFLY